MVGMTVCNEPVSYTHLESCIIYTALINILRKALFRFSQSAARLCALNQRNAFFDQLLLAGLNSKIALCKCLSLIHILAQNRQCIHKSVDISVKRVILRFCHCICFLFTI